MKMRALMGGPGSNGTEPKVTRGRGRVDPDAGQLHQNDNDIVVDPVKWLFTLNELQRGLFTALDFV
jgi:hypothetical protein